MRSLLRVVLLLALLCAPAFVSAQADVDDLALAEIGVDLSHANAATAAAAIAPKPTYTSVMPLDHEAGLIAKFPLLHEIKGEDAKDWGQIQNLLFKEPAAAMSSDIDVKLDELEEKFNKIDKMPVPSSIAPKDSTLLPKVKEVEWGLKSTLPKKQLRLMQLKNKLAESQKSDAKDGNVSKKEKKLQSKAATKAESKAKVASQAKALAKASKALAKAMKKTLAAKKAVAKKVGAASSQDSKIDRKRVLATVSTVRLIEKRLSGLQTLFGRLKNHLGMDLEKEVAAVATKSSKNRRSKAWQALADEMERRQKNRRTVESKARFAQSDLDSEAEADADAESEDAAEAEADDEAMDEAESEADAEDEAESESESEEQSLAETAADADSNNETESDADDEAEVESEAESEAELNQDAEVVEEILASFL